jgi:hypothetical protein
MRTLRMTILLGLAGMAWKYLKPKLPAAKAQLAKARERVEPALRDATTKVRSASKDAAESVRDVSLSAAETADAVAGAIAEPDAGATPASNAQQAHATSQRG